MICSCESHSNTELNYLENWNAGKVVSAKTVKIFGEENIFISSEITDEIFARIYGKSYKIGCEIPREDLRYLKLLHYDIEGEIHIGEMICDKSIASDLTYIFKELYNAQYPIERMVLIDDYNADDETSMRNNNSSAFNYREITGGGKLSKHALGLAVDINPLYNPYVKILPNGQLHIEPHNSEPYIDRTKKFHYKIDSTDLCYKLFKQYGFEWGGEWDTRKDYQHFER